MNPDLPSAPIDSADPLPMAIDMTPQELIERNEEIRQKDYELSMANLGSYTLGGDEIYKPKGKDLKEVCRVASHKELVSILDGKADFSTTSEQLYSPALIGLGLKEMNLHTESFDQEATNFLGILGDSMVTLNRPLTKGTYVEGVNGTYYSAGVAWREGSAKTLCVIHSHPSRTIWKEREREKNNPLPPPEKLQLDAHVPSIQDFLSILVQRDEEDAANENSMIVAGPKIALMIYRTNQSPEKLRR